MASFTSIPLGQLGKTVFGPNIAGQKIRGFYEPSTPTTQCNNTIGKFIEGTPCYICGMRIYTQPIIGDGLNPECEHLLPIAQAILFLGLYGNKFKKNQLFYNPDILPIEYAWAHRTCNQIKSDDSYITYNGDNNVGQKYQIDNDGIKQLLKKIWNNTRSDSNEFNKQLHLVYSDNLKTFVKERTNTSTEINYNNSIIKPFQDIVNYLNSYDAPEMLFLIGATKAMEGPMTEEASTLIGTVNREASKDNSIHQLKLQLENKYDTIVKSVETSLHRSFGNNSQTYIKYNEMAQLFKPFYVALYVKIPSKLRTDWEEYVKIKLLSIFYQTNIDEPNAITTLLYISQDNPISNSLLVKSRHAVTLSKVIAKEKIQPWYSAIQAEEDKLTNSNTNMSFENAAKNYIFSVPAKKAKSAKNQRTKIANNGSLVITPKYRQAKPGIKFRNRGAEAQKRRRTQKNIELSKRRRRGMTSTIVEANDMNKSGGRRKTRKNKKLN